MRHLLSFALTGVLLTGPLAGMAHAITVRDLIALNQAGLGDDVLVALIDADDSVFTLTPMDVIELKRQGLSDRVLIRMIETARRLPPAMPARDATVAPVRAPVTQAQAPSASAPVVSQTVIQKVEVVQAPPRRTTVERPRTVYVPVAVPVRTPVRQVKEPEPVYWGWGGQRRPDSWEPSKTPDKKKPTGKVIRNQ